MNGRVLKTIAVKDLKEVRQNRAAWIPALVVPLVFFVLIPLLITAVPTLFHVSMSLLVSESGPVAMMRDKIPELAARLSALNDQQIWVVLMTGYLFAPFILVMPLMLSTIIGAESFVGEKERKTIEALVYSPATDGELFVGKMLASVAPAVVLAWLGFVVYGLVVNVASWPVMGRIWFPPATWWPLMLWVTPAIATLGMAVTVLISAKASTFMEAYQMSASLVVLVLGLVVVQATGVLYLSVGVTWVVGLVLWIAAAMLVLLGIRNLSRERLLSRI